MRAWWIYPFIVVGGALQTVGAAMNAQLNASLANRWLASSVSFGGIFAFFACVFAVQPEPLPTARALAEMPWWAPLGGLVGAVQVYAGLSAPAAAARLSARASPSPARRRSAASPRPTHAAAPATGTRRPRC
jgi:uncharacterized membrane protein YdcZ (DUF606 family)